MASSNVETFRAAHDSFNSRKFDEVIACFTEDFRYTDNARGTSYTRQGFKDDFMAGWVKAFSDARVTDREYIDGGDTVICRFTGRGTNDGPLEAAPPTGRTMAIAFCEILRFDAQGRVTGGEAYYDSASILTQLGLLPTAALT